MFPPSCRPPRRDAAVCRRRDSAVCLRQTLVDAFKVIVFSCYCFVSKYTCILMCVDPPSPQIAKTAVWTSHPPTQHIQKHKAHFLTKYVGGWPSGARAMKLFDAIKVFVLFVGHLWLLITLVYPSETCPLGPIFRQNLRTGRTHFVAGTWAPTGRFQMGK